MKPKPWVGPLPMVSPPDLKLLDFLDVSNWKVVRNKKYRRRPESVMPAPKMNPMVEICRVRADRLHDLVGYVGSGLDLPIVGSDGAGYVAQLPAQAAPSISYAMPGPITRYGCWCRRHQGFLGDVTRLGSLVYHLAVRRGSRP